MRILLTGSLGYVGAYLHQRLGQAHQIEAIDERVGCVYQGISQATVRSFDAVVHVAAHSSVKACAADPWGGIRNNLFGPVELAEKMDGKPLIYASSSSVHAVGGRTVYDATKRAADEILPVIYPNAHALRFGTVFGVSPVMREDTMINAMTLSAVRLGTIRARNQHKWRPVLTLDDLGWFVEQCLAGEVAPGLHDVATFLCRIGGYADMVREVTGATIVSERDTPTYDFKMGVLGRTQSIYPVIEELVAHWTRQ